MVNTTEQLTNKLETTEFVSKDLFTHPHTHRANTVVIFKFKVIVKQNKMKKQNKRKTNKKSLLVAINHLNR